MPNRRSAIALVTLSATLALTCFIAAVNRAESTERALVESGMFAGGYFPDDKANAVVHPYPLLSHPADLVGISERPLRIVRSAPSGTTYDFGNAAFGALRLVPLAPQRRAMTVDVSLGERLDQFGHVSRYVAARDGAQQMFVASTRRSAIIAPGMHEALFEGPVRFRPKRGILPASLGAVLPFRYAEIVGIPPDRYIVERIAVRYPFDETAAAFRSSDPVLDLVWRTGVHSIKATSYAGLYLDGNRERRPYEADAYIQQLGHYSIDRDYRLARHTLEYLIGNPNSFAEWLMFPVFMAFEDYRYSGDVAYLRSIYPYLRRRSLSEVASADETIGDWQGSKGLAFAHALGLNAAITDLIDWPEGERDRFALQRIPFPAFLHQTARMAAAAGMAKVAAAVGDGNAAVFYAMSADGFNHRRYRIVAPNIVTNSFRYATLRRLAYLANALGETTDRRQFDTAAERLQETIMARFLDRPAGLFRDGGRSAHHSAHANMFPMAFGLVPKRMIATVADFIAARDMPVGVYGAQFLLEALYAAGRGDAALARLRSTSGRSWYNMVARTGSTIATEAWNDRIKPNQDWNHPWGTAPVNLIARGLMGIVPTEPGFTAFAVRPQPGALHWATIRVPTVKGGITATYRNGGKRISLRVTVPVGARATLGLAMANVGAFASFRLDGRSVLPRAAGAFFEVGGIKQGSHHLEAYWP